MRWSAGVFLKNRVEKQQLSMKEKEGSDAGQKGTFRKKGKKLPRLSRPTI